MIQKEIKEINERIRYYNPIFKNPLLEDNIRSNKWKIDMLLKLILKDLELFKFKKFQKCSICRFETKNLNKEYKGIGFKFKESSTTFCYDCFKKDIMPRPTHTAGAIILKHPKHPAIPA